MFESRVILDGSQTILLGRYNDDGFESRVILDGSQTLGEKVRDGNELESRVILDGSQTVLGSGDGVPPVWESCYFRW